MDLNERSKVACCSLVISGVLLAFNEHIAQELVFPANAAYSIVTFYLTYSETSIFRHYIFSILLSFTELFWIYILKIVWNNEIKLQEPLKTDFLILFTEFFVMFVAIRTMSKKEIYSEFKNSTLRTPIFVLKGYFKARALIECLRILTLNSTSQISQFEFIIGIICSGLIAASPALIYIIDSFLCCEISVKQISIDGIFKLVKISMLVAALSMIIELFVPASIEVRIGYSVSSLVVYFSYIIHYSLEAYRYSNNFTR